MINSILFKCLENQIDIMNDNRIRLVEIQGISATGIINTSSISGYDGSTVISSQMPMRNITIMLRFIGGGDAEEDKIRLYKTFMVKSFGILYLMSQKNSVKIDCIVEKIDIPPNAHPLVAQISLLCPFPYFTDLEPNIQVMSALKPLFRFPFTFPPKLNYIGETTETGAGDKSPDNLYTITGKGENGTITITSGDTSIDIAVDSPLYGNDTVQDCVCRKNGVWGIKRYFNKYVFTGTETGWGANTNFNTWSESEVYHGYLQGLKGIIKNKVNIGDDSNCIINTFNDLKKYATENLKEEGFYEEQNGNIYLFVSADRLTEYTSTGYKNYISSLYTAGTPIYMIYELETPTFTPFSDDVQDLLNPIFCFKFSERDASVSSYFENKSTVDVYPIIEMKAITALTNPSIINLTDPDNYKTMKVNVSMSAGDILRIDTRIGQKTITKNGINVFNSKDCDFEFFKLKTGKNLLKYDADTNSGGLQTTVIWDNLYGGV